SLSILHELGHAIGLYHEHSRPDRDKFVFVHYNNITKNMSHEFDKIDPREYVNFNKPYDYRSIMHYSKRAFAANPNGITLETIDEDYADIIGKATVLSFYDVMLVNAMYNCSEDCTNKTCPDKGFLTESCDCYCPSILQMKHGQNVQALNLNDHKTSREINGPVARGLLKALLETRNLNLVP
ncbi:hypothetical protein DPMN_153643, partial [Dreissena polymorpha]